MKLTRYLIFVVFVFSQVAHVYANDIRVAYNNISKSLDPYERLTIETRRTTTMVFNSLVRISNTGEHEPSLAYKWVKIDENTTRFYLLDDVYFHSGKKLNVDDVIFTFQRIKVSPEAKEIFSPIDDVKAVDDYTFDMITKRPSPVVLNIASLFFLMDSEFYSGKSEDGSLKDAINIDTKSYAALNTSGTGPFTVVGFDEEKIVFEKNKNFWKKTESNIDTVTIEKVEDEVSRVNKLISGDVDIINPVGISGIKKIKNLKNIRVVNLPGESLLTYLINFERAEGLKDKKIREAISYAIDKKLIIDETMKDLATPAEQFSPPMYSGHNKSLESRYDPKKSVQLISEAKFKGPLVFDMIAPDYKEVKISEMIVEMLKAVGIQINLTFLPEDEYWDLADNGAADLIQVGWFSDTMDSNNFFEYLVACPGKDSERGKFNSGKYCNPEVDQLIQEANVIMNPATRELVLHKIEELLYDDAMHLPLYWDNVVWLARSDIPLENIISGIDVPYFEELIINGN